MIDPRDSSRVYLAPGSVSSGAMRLPGSSESRAWPDLRDPDDHLVEPETRQEIFRGQLVEVSPARPGHGDTHCRLDAAVRLCTREGYVASTDLLTRRDHDSDFATDTCVRKAGTVQGQDGETRHLEELSFEVFHTQSRSLARERARDVIASGVRRMFGLFVDPLSPAQEAAGQAAVTVEEWSPVRDAWIALDPGRAIEDPCLAAPLPVAALMDAAALDDAVARMLIARHNPVIEELARTSHDAGYDKGHDAGYDKGQLAGQIAAVLELLAYRGIALTPAQRARIAACDDPIRLAGWITRSLSIESADELFVAS